MAVALVATLASGCTHVMYKGPARPSSEVAHLRTDDIYVEKVDGIDASGTSFELLPGNHTVSYRLNAIGLLAHLSSRLVSSCLKLKAGHSYTLKAAFAERRRWAPVLIDDVTQRSILAVCGPDEDED